MARHRFRPRLPFAPRHEKGFAWRGREVSRLEGLTDAVFAFAVTLLVVAVEVPHTFDGLMDVVRYLPAFAICFTLLMTFWTAHYHYFRRYGLEDGITRVLTMAILFLVLFAVYPLKFLFAMVTSSLFSLHLSQVPHLETLGQLRTLYLIYGLGFAGVWTLYAALYRHALNCRDALGLTPIERIDTEASFWSYVVYVVVCFSSITLAYTTDSTGAPGLVYCALAPLQMINGRLHAARRRREVARSDVAAG